MHVDYRIQKPISLRGYKLHRMVTGLTHGRAALFADEGETLVIRTECVLDSPSVPVMKFDIRDMTAFELCACVSRKIKGTHVYFPISDWSSRHDWLALKGEKYGFEPLTLHSTSRMVEINDGRRVFKIDQTHFTGILRVTDAERFHCALTTGVGSTAKTFGYGMLIVD
jgi:hypothetical protein